MTAVNDMLCNMLAKQCIQASRRFIRQNLNANGAPSFACIIMSLHHFVTCS